MSDFVDPPMRWRRVPIGRLFRRRETRGRPDLPLLSVYRDLGVVQRAGRDDNYNKPGEDLDTYKHVQPGDLVLNKMKTWQGSLGVSSHEGIVSPAYFVAQPIAPVDSRFIHHMLRSRPMIAEYAARSKGIRPNQWDLPWDEFSHIAVALPSEREQRAIAYFLDAEIARIDALIAKKRQLMKLLEERWISELDVRLDSLSKRFENGPIRVLCLLVLDCVNKTAPTVADETAYIMVRTSNVLSGAVHLDDVLHVDAATYSQWTRRGRPRRGDVLLTREAPLGNVGILHTDRKVFLGQRLMMYRADPRKSLPEYLLYCLWAPQTQRQMNLLGAGSLHEHLRVGDCLKLSVPLAPRDEQEELVQALGLSRRRIHRATQALACQISLLSEHQRALVTAAVTGQLEIPGAAA